MRTKCINCESTYLEPKTIQLQGEVRGETYVIDMPGLECASCGYMTIEGSGMPEFGRLLADKYRAAHGLLTSEEIHGIRQRLEMSQEAFADFLGVGIASVKRWEMGKIQDERNDALIREKTEPSRVDTITAFAYTPIHSTTQYMTIGSILIDRNVVALKHPEFMLDEAGENLSYVCERCHDTAVSWSLLSFPDHQIAPYYINPVILKERRSRVRN